MIGRSSLMATLLTSLILGTGGQGTFTNPIVDRNSPDPAVLRLGDSYYLTLSTNTEREMSIFKSPTLTNFRNAESKVIFRVPGNHSDLWASELHKIKDQLLIYFTYKGGGENHKMYVIEAEDPDDPMGSWGPPILLQPELPEGIIDGTVLEHGNGEMYFVFSRMGSFNLWIAKMVNTTFVDGPSATLLRNPEEDWECRGLDGRYFCLNEGPYFIYRGNTSFLIFSGGETFSPHYALGLMSIEGDKDPMDQRNWWMGPGVPVFQSNEEESVYCTGHAAFTTSPDGMETWMVYHGTDSVTNINGNRVARVEKIEWTEAGSPVFPKPHGFNTSISVPSGQAHF